MEITVKEPNRPPVFPTEGFSFSVNESMELYGAVGYAVATDPDGDAVTYAITGGDQGNQFSIDLNQGLIVVRRSLNLSATSSYTMTVKSTDAHGNASSATVAVSVVQTAEDPPPAPTGLAALPEDAGDLIVTWNRVANAPKYRLRYRTESTAGWTTTAAAAGTSQTLSSVTCGATYEVQAQAQGDGVSYTAEWGDPSGSVSTAVPLCPAPEFGETSYDLTVAEDASVGAVVGTVAATYPDQTRLTYSITAGNDDSKFAVGAGGVITVAGALDYETTVAYKLTVEASDGRGGAATAMVRISLGDVAEDGPPPPPSVTYAYNTVPGTFGFNWTAVMGADRYRVQYRVGGAEGTWTNLDATTETSQTFSPEGGVECGTTYEFRVQAHGDGQTHPAVWGARTGGVKYVSPACSSPST